MLLKRLGSVGLINFDTISYNLHVKLKNLQEPALNGVIYWILPEQSRVDNYRATRLKRDLDDSHENLYLYLNMCVTINYQIHDILATRMGYSGL